ncbi:hypothetical protein KY346_06610 [Candidatus Woesearchaeota archaeon]|nr:hypothetical protein [Candidatus Woesearchaeota archaeon]
MLKKVLTQDELYLFKQYIDSVDNDNALLIADFEQNCLSYPQAIPAALKRGGIEVPDEIILKQFEKAFNAEESKKYQALANLLKSCKIIFKTINPGILNKIKEMADQNADLQAELDKMFDKKEETAQAENAFKEGDYFRAYQIYKWAGLLDKEILAKILEKLKEKDLRSYIQICYQEDQKIDPKEGLEIAEKLEKSEDYGAALTAYYLIDDKQKIKELIEKLKKKNEE